MNEEPTGETDSFRNIEAEQQIGKFIEVRSELTPMNMPSMPLSQILLTADARVVFIQDTHGETPLGNILNYPDAAILARQGFTHYLVEGSTDVQPLLDELGKGKAVQLAGDLRLSPTGMNNQQDIHAIHNMAGRGLKVLAIDHPANADPSRSVTKEEREQFIHDRIREVIDNGGRAILSMGATHAVPGSLPGVPSVANRLLANGTDVVSVAYQKPISRI